MSDSYIHVKTHCKHIPLGTTQSATVVSLFIQLPHTLSNFCGMPLLMYVALYKGAALFTTPLHADTDGGLGFFHDNTIIFLA